MAKKIEGMEHERKSLTLKEIKNGDKVVVLRLPMLRTDFNTAAAKDAPIETRREIATSFRDDSRNGQIHTVTFEGGKLFLVPEGMANQEPIELDAADEEFGGLLLRRA